MKLPGSRFGDDEDDLDSACPKSLAIQYRQYLPYGVVSKYVKSGTIDPEGWNLPSGEDEKPWTVESRPHNAIEPGSRQVKDADGYFVENAVRMHKGWGLAIGLDAGTHQSVQTLSQGRALVMRLGGEGHRVLLELCQPNTLDQQWQELQRLSRANFEKNEKSLAYLVTPGVFERATEGKARCQAWPWEWKLAHAVNGNQTPGLLVGVATDKPVPISCRLRASKDHNKGDSIPAPQVFAAPPGSVYYLNSPPKVRGDYPLFQDDPPPARNGRPHKSRIWRKLGYSELLWIPYVGENA